MQPITITVTAQAARSPRALCEDFLDTRRWSEFTGFFPLPGIQSAAFETRTPGLVGSRIRVQNTDGSAHVEEIITWDAPERIAVRFQDFAPPLQRLATHFLETWTFQPAPDGTRITRRMELYPTSRWARLALLPIAFLMRRAFQKQLRQTTA